MKGFKVLIHILLFCLFVQNTASSIRLLDCFKGIDLTILNIADDSPAEDDTEEKETESKDNENTKEKEKELKNFRSLDSFTYLSWLSDFSHKRGSLSSLLPSLSYETETPPPKKFFTV